MKCKDCCYYSPRTTDEFGNTIIDAQCMYPYEDDNAPCQVVNSSEYVEFPEYYDKD